MNARDVHPDVIRRLVNQFAYQIKFVVDTLQMTCQEIDQYLQQFPEIDADSVMLMPQGTDPELWRNSGVAGAVCQRGMRFCPRKQVEWFGLVRGT